MKENKDARTLVKANHGQWLEKFGENWKRQLALLQETFGKAILETVFPGEWPTDVPIVRVDPKQAHEVLRFLKEDSGCDYGFLADYFATDETPREPRFDLVIQLLSIKKFWRLRVKIPIAESEQFPTLIPLWEGANWAEREIFDMYGIRFKGHPDLRRILTDERFEGHPLRKDYPLHGYQIFPTPEPINPGLLE